MKKYWKRGVVIGLGSIFFLEIASIDAMSLRFVSYAKENEEVFSDVEWNGVNTIYTGDEMILSGERKGDFEIDENGVLKKYYGDGGDVVIPEGVTEIGDSAFQNDECIGSLDGLTSVTIPEGVTTIGNSAFYWCGGLTSITIPEGVTTIGNFAFYGCRGLTSITIPEGVTTIKKGTFEYCSGLTSVIIPEGVTEIEASAFRDCSKLTNVIIPKGVTEIGEAAFGKDYFSAAIIDNLTIYCYADSYAETYAKENNIPYQLLDTVENSDITTTDIPNAVQYIPYNTILQNNNQDSENEVRYSFKEGSLPNGIELKSDGELQGIPTETGEFTFTILMENSGDFPSSEKTYTLTITENTNEAVDSITDEGYALTERVPDIDLSASESQTLVSQGEFREFRDVYLDGVKLIRDEDYFAEEGSTRITIRSQTLTRVGEGTHTIVLEFESNTGIKRAAQNYTVSSVADNSNSNNNDVTENESNQSESSQNESNQNENHQSEEESNIQVENENQDITNTEEESNNPDSSQDSQENPVTEYIFYTVERGDNLWRISQKHYGTGRYWEEIFRNNLDTIKDANRIYSRQVIKIPQK